MSSSYHYSDHRAWVLTDEGQRCVFACGDLARELLRKSGAVLSNSLLGGYSPSPGNSWQMLAVIDRLVELGRLIEIPNPKSGAGQHRVFLSPELFSGA
jgi:hypothetical protein